MFLVIFSFDHRKRVLIRGRPKGQILQHFPSYSFVFSCFLTFLASHTSSPISGRSLKLCSPNTRVKHFALFDTCALPLCAVPFTLLLLFCFLPLAGDGVRWCCSGFSLGGLMRVWVDESVCLSVVFFSSKSFYLPCGDFSFCFLALEFLFFPCS